MSELVHCSACVLPSTFPNITFNAQGGVGITALDLQRIEKQGA
jgi:hypothetical protein